MPKPKETSDRKPQAHKANAGGPIPCDSKGWGRDDRRVYGSTATPSNCDPSKPHEDSAKKIPIPTKENLILSKMDRTSLLRRFRFKRNAPDDSKHYEITKQTHSNCSVLNPTNGTPRFRRPRSDMNKDGQDIQDGFSFILLILSILVILSYLPDGQPRKTKEAQEGDRGTPMFLRYLRFLLFTSSDLFSAEATDQSLRNSTYLHPRPSVSIRGSTAFTAPVPLPTPQTEHRDSDAPGHTPSSLFDRADADECRRRMGRSHCRRPLGEVHFLLPLTLPVRLRTSSHTSAGRASGVAVRTSTLSKVRPSTWRP